MLLLILKQQLWTEELEQFEILSEVILFVVFVYRFLFFFLKNTLGTLVDIDNIGCARGQTSTILGQFQASIWICDLTHFFLKAVISFQGLGYKELAQIALYVLFLDPAFHNENEGLSFKKKGKSLVENFFLDNECPLPEVEEIVAKAQVNESFCLVFDHSTPLFQAIARSDFERETELFPAGTGDKVELQLVSDKDVSTMDFATKMELWRKSMDAKGKL